MFNSKLSLLTIRSSDPDRAVRFYEALGLTFDKHAHGKGPEHYCSHNAGIVFEIYPLEPGKQPTTDTRIGFSVDSVGEVVAHLRKLGFRLITPPSSSQWGERAVAVDADGHRVELVATGQ